MLAVSMGWGDGDGGGSGVLRSRTNAELQRDIVHLSQISCWWNSLSTSSAGENTLSCGSEITGAHVVQHH